MPDMEMRAATDAEYVRKDVFEAHMQRIDQRFDAIQMLMEKTLAEMKADNEKLRMEMKADNEKLRTEMMGIVTKLDNKIENSNIQLRSEIRVLDTRINDLQTTVYWGFAIVGIFVALLGFFITFAPSIWGMLKKRGRPLVSRREMENLLAKYLGTPSGLSEGVKPL